MANQRDIKNRIKSISNTKKITSTMEMVSSAKMKKMQTRLEKSKPYEGKINEIIAHLSKSGVDPSFNPLLVESANPTRALILQVTGNRGLCASFNTNVIENTLAHKKKLAEDGIDSQIYAIGKKGFNYFNFIGESMYKFEENPEDKLSFDDAIRLGSELTRLFLSGEVHEVYISYTRVISAAVQKPKIVKLLPITPDADENFDPMSDFSTDYYFEPSPFQIFSYIFPLYIKVKIFTCLLESGFSEHFARRVSMKNATDASEDMVKELTITYNRVRQAKITNEIAEIVGGAAALE